MAKKRQHQPAPATTNCPGCGEAIYHPQAAKWVRAHGHMQLQHRGNVLHVCRPDKTSAAAPVDADALRASMAAGIADRERAHNRRVKGHRARGTYTR